MKRINFIRNIVIILFIITILNVGINSQKSSKINLKNYKTSIMTSSIMQEDTLTEWQLFVMALIEVECERDPKAKSNKNAIGPLQITPIYVAEVNRIYNTDYKFEDAWDLDKALEMFELTNDYYNPNRDIDKAIKLHNPGAGKWYADRIKKRMIMIKFSEEVRIKLKNQYG